MDKSKYLELCKAADVPSDQRRECIAWMEEQFKDADKSKSVIQLKFESNDDSKQWLLEFMSIVRPDGSPIKVTKTRNWRIVQEEYGARATIY